MGENHLELLKDNIQCTDLQGMKGGLDSDIQLAEPR